MHPHPVILCELHWGGGPTRIIGKNFVACFRQQKAYSNPHPIIILIGQHHDQEDERNARNKVIWYFHDLRTKEVEQQAQEERGHRAQSAFSSKNSKNTDSTSLELRHVLVITSSSSSCWCLRDDDADKKNTMREKQELLGKNQNPSTSCCSNPNTQIKSVLEALLLLHISPPRLQIFFKYM